MSSAPQSLPLPSATPGQGDLFERDLFAQHTTITRSANELWLCLGFPTLALGVFSQEERASQCNFVANSPANLLAVTEQQNAQTIIWQCSDKAREQGITPGMRLAAAHALCQELLVRPRDLYKETETLKQLAVWAGQFSPMVSLLSPDGLLIEIQGSLRLFGGTEGLRKRVQKALGRQGYELHFAMAPTPLAAQWLVSCNQQQIIDDPGALTSVLGELPIQCLVQSLAQYSTQNSKLPAKTLNRLSKMGLISLTDLFRLPRQGLARRFGHELLQQLDRALGYLPDLREPFVAPETFQTSVELPMGSANAGDLLIVAQRLLDKLCGFLHNRVLAMQGFELRLIHTCHVPTHVVIALSYPSQDSEHCLLLLKERLMHQSLPAAVVEMGLYASEFQGYQPQHRSLFARHDKKKEGWWQVLEQLQSRFGDDAIHGLQALPDHRPEYAWMAVRPGQTVVAEPSTPSPRPLWLLTCPKRLTQRHDGQPVWKTALRLKQGPERIEQGWWDDNDTVRDYYHAVNGAGTHLWIFFDRCAEEWFLQGFFS